MEAAQQAQPPPSSPPDCHRLGCAVTGDEGDEPGDVSVLQRGDNTQQREEERKRENKHAFQCSVSCRNPRV